ncbi:AfsR/SARP family transcriptional regulator [Nonomuraea sp. NN258]|uniref:BTAD domain-containing putative transcriptional regulator n=1 Tax=Nonomuraea antri TaxID=2730852 RepID=UPI0015698797|nr:BTAD domain-containing putative transcriptional regulator [Nonomuraea antri]NRQ39042.1 AfsR/SARP family transcriptional regulator [Nonomuraea antri]
MRFGVLGPLVAWTPDGEPVQVPEVKVRALLADLLINRGRPVSADRLIEDLWGDRPPGNPAAALRVKVSQLRGALGDRTLPSYQAPGYVLRVSAEDVDAGLFQTLIERARETGDLHERRSLLTRALELWRGSAYAEFADAEFAAATVARLDEQRLVAVEELAETRLALGEHGLLAAELAEQVAGHPLRERLRAVQLRALYRAGRQSDALAGYADLRDRLADELGLDPAPELVALHQAILEQDPALDAPAALDTPAARRTNLPAPLTELVGRREAVAEVRGLLRSRRLVTLTGPGGVGKTRLALAAAAADPGDGARSDVWLVELASLAGRAPTAEVAETVAGVLGLRDDGRDRLPKNVRDETPGSRPGSGPDGGRDGDSNGDSGRRSVADRLAAALRGRETLLVLDNCEHVVEQVAELAARLLRDLPRLRILATSQESLRIEGEALWSVPPLDQAAAVELFAARAGIGPGDDPDGAIAEICARLDGVPLALELAATRMRALTPRQLADRLDDRFRLLAQGQRGAPARQQTLRAMIDWSWELLTEPERVVLRRLAAHADGCTLEAAEEICAEPGVDVLDLLARLVDRSLVVRAAGPRYRLLESVSAYCQERLAEAGELADVQLRHVRYYAGLAERAEPHLRGHGQRSWLALLDADAAEVRAALDTAVRLGAAGEAVRLVNAMAWYWVLRGRLNEGRRAMESTLSISDDPRTRVWLAGFELLAGRLRTVDAAVFDSIEDPLDRARARWLVGYASFGYDDLSLSRDLVRQALTGFEELGDRWGTAAALTVLAKWAHLRGDLAALRTAGERGLALFSELGDRWGELYAGENLSMLAEITGDYEKAVALRLECLRGAEELGLWSTVSGALSRLGRISMLTGDYARADDYHERARVLAVSQSNRPAEEFAEIGLALSARRQGRLDEAERLLHRWLDWVLDVWGQPGTALIYAELGFVAELRGDASAALCLQLRGLDAARSVGDPRATALALEGLAGALAAAGRAEVAALLLGKAAALRSSVGAPLPWGERGDVARIEAAVRAALGAAGLADGLSRGATLPLDALLAHLPPEETTSPKETASPRETASSKATASLEEAGPTARGPVMPVSSPGVRQPAAPSRAAARA